MTFVKVVARPCRACGHDSAALDQKTPKAGYPGAFRVLCGNDRCGAFGPWAAADTGAVMRWNETKGAR